MLSSAVLFTLNIRQRFGSLVKEEERISEIVVLFLIKETVIILPWTDCVLKENNHLVDIT